MKPVPEGQVYRNLLTCYRVVIFRQICEGKTHRISWMKSGFDRHDLIKKRLKESESEPGMTLGFAGGNDLSS